MIKMTALIITHDFKNESAAIAYYFTKKVSVGIRDAMGLERESKLHGAGVDVLHGLTCRLNAAGIYFTLAAGITAYHASNTVCAALAYDRAAKDAGQL